MSKTLRDYLLQEFDKRRGKNSSYSIRGFARDLELDATALSRILAGTRPIGAKVAQKLVEALKLSPTTRATLLNSLIAPQDHGIPSDDQYVALSSPQLEQMDEWIYSATLALVDTQKLKLDPPTLAEYFGLPLGKIQTVIDRLLGLGLIKRTERGYRKTYKSSTTLEKGSRALRQIHVGYLERAIHSLKLHSDDATDISGITLLISSDKLPEAKRRIKEFRRSLAQYLEAPVSSSNPQLYRIGIQLFPLKK